MEMTMGHNSCLGSLGCSWQQIGLAMSDPRTNLFSQMPSPPPSRRPVIWGKISQLGKMKGHLNPLSGDTMCCTSFSMHDTFSLPEKELFILIFFSFLCRHLPHVCSWRADISPNHRLEGPLDSSGPTPAHTGTPKAWCPGPCLGGFWGSPFPFSCL